MSFDPLTAALDIGGKLIDRLWPDPAQRDAAKLQLLQMQQSGELAELTADTDLAKAQIAVNQTEAANPSVFVAGWRPFVGWTCGVAMAYIYMGREWLTLAVHAYSPAVQLPQIQDTAGLFSILGLLLGARTLEKVRGVSTSRVGGNAP